MAIVAVSLGSSPTGAGGDTNREAFTKLNASVSDLDARGLGVDGAAGVGVPVGGTAGQALTKIDATDHNTEWTTLPAGVLETVAGGAGFANVSGAVALDLTGARHFLHTATGNITALSFTNVPAAATASAAWTWVLAIDATGGYTLAGTPAVTFVDGHSFADADLTASAVNIFSFWLVGTITYGALVTNGTLALDPYTLTFPEAGTLLIAVTRAEDIDLSDVTHLEADGTAGTGTLTFKKNGGANLSTTGGDNPTAFAAGEVLSVILTGSTTASAVSIPRFA